MYSLSNFEILIIHAPAGLSPIRYALYARKSSEDDERQALSVDSQVKEMLSIAEHHGIIVVETRTKSQSAKHSGGRPVFTNLSQIFRLGCLTVS